MTATNTNQIEQIKNELARCLGESPDRISQITPQWLNFMRGGVVVDLHVGRWRGRSKLEYKDLGLPEPKGGADEQALAGLLTLGRKNLLPSRYLKRFDAIEASARKVVAENGTDTYWGVFVAAERYQEKVKPALVDYYQGYFETLTDMVQNFESVKMELADEYRHQARLAFQRLSRIAPDLVNLGENEFVEGFVANILTLIPSIGTIQESYSFEWDLRFIPLPDLLSQESGQIAMFDSKTQSEYEELNHQRQLNRIVEGAETARQRKISEAEIKMRAEIVAKARAEKETQVTAFMRDLVAQLRTMVYEASTDILGTIQKNDRLHPRSVVQIRNLVEAVNQMNFFGDRDVDQMINRVRQEMNKVQVSENKGIGGMRDVLEAVATLTRETLINLGETPRSGRDVGIVDVPTLADTRQARMALDFVIEPMEETRKGRTG